MGLWRKWRGVFPVFQVKWASTIGQCFVDFWTFLRFAPFETIWGFKWFHLEPFEAKKHVAFRCLVSWKRRVFVWFRCLWASHWWFLVSQSSVFYELFELLHLSRDDERKSTWFTVIFWAIISCFALLDHKSWPNVSSRIALLAGLSPLPHFLCLSPPETDECIG